MIKKVIENKRYGNLNVKKKNQNFTIFTTKGNLVCMYILQFYMLRRCRYSLLMLTVVDTVIVSLSICL